MDRSFEALSQQNKTLFQIPALCVELKPTEFSNRTGKMLSNFIQCRVNDIVGPFTAGHCVGEDHPKILEQKFNLCESLSWQIIFEASTFLISHRGPPIHPEHKIDEFMLRGQ